MALCASFMLKYLLIIQTYQFYMRKTDDKNKQAIKQVTTREHKLFQFSMQCMILVYHFWIQKYTLSRRYISINVKEHESIKCFAVTAEGTMSTLIFLSTWLPLINAFLILLLALTLEYMIYKSI